MASHLTPVELSSDVNIMYGGEFRTRAIMLNDLGENDGGWFDNRLRFDLAAKLGERLGIAWNTEVGDIVWADFGNKNVAVETRELYLDYTCAMTGMKVRLGQQYWYDHRSLILDDYFSGISADLDIAGIPTELGFIKAYEGEVNKLDDTHVAFANFAFKTPVDWGITAMWGQCHDAKEADFWVVPYFMLNFEPVALDLTAVINQQMFPENAEGDESEMGIAVAAKADIDMGVKVGADFLMVTEEGINTLSPYYENGLYILGNKLPYDGVQLGPITYYNSGEAYMSVVGKLGYPISEKLAMNAAFGMATLDDPLGMEVNVGLDYKVMDKLSFNPVLAICMPEEDSWGNDNMIYMLGGLLKAEF